MSPRISFKILVFRVGSWGERMSVSSMNGVADHAEQIALSPAELLSALAEHEQRSAVLALATRRVEVAGEWAFDGSVSIAAWLRNNGRMSHRSAARLVRRGRFLDRFCAIADAALDRVLSEGQLDALQAVCQPKHEALLAEHQQVLVAALAPLPVADAETVCQVWRQQADAVIDADEPPTEPIRKLTFDRANDRALLGRFTLDDAAATEFEKAIRNAATWGTGETRTRPQVNGDALFDIAAFYNKNHTRTGTPRHLPHVSLSLDATTLLADLPVAVNDDNQQLIDPACTDSYLCDCFLHTIIRDTDGVPLSFGRARYVVPRKLFRQIAARDGGCRFPGLRPHHPLLRRPPHPLVAPPRHHRLRQPRAALQPTPPHRPPTTTRPQTAPQRPTRHHLAHRPTTNQPTPRRTTTTQTHVIQTSETAATVLDMELTSALDFIRSRQNGVLVTLKRDGRPQLSNITYALGADEVLRISITADRAKYINLLRDARASLYVSKEDFWGYVVIDANAELSPPAADPNDATVEELIVLYRDANGEHPDWGEYRAAMVTDRRVVVRLNPVHAYGMGAE